MNPDIPQAGEALATARGRVLDSRHPAFLVDGDGIIVAWNTGAAGFFGVPAWSASAHHCARVVQGRTRDGHLVCSVDCPVLRNPPRSPEKAVMAFAARGVAPAIVRHELVRDPEGGLVGVIHELLPAALH